jgi:DNA polymerase III subunit beta
MKFTANRTDILDAVASVSAVLPTRSTMPVLGNVLLTAEGNKLTIVGTDKEQSLYITIDAEVEENGGFAVGAKKLGEILRELPDGDIKFVLEDAHLNVIQNKRKIKLPGIMSDEFPNTELIKTPKQSFEIETNVLMELLDLTSFAISAEITRLNLSGLLWQVFPNEMRMVATDGHKLALVKKKAKIDTETAFDLLMPERAVSKLMPIVTKCSSDNISITPGDGSIQFEAENFKFQSKLIMEKFPDYERVLPTTNDIFAICDKTELASVVRLMTTVSSPLTHLVKFAFSKESLELFTNDLDAGTEGSSTITIDFDSEPMSLGFNTRMMLEILKHIPTEQLRISMKNSAIACMITPFPQPEDFEYVTVLMPLHLPGE